MTADTERSTPSGTPAARVRPGRPDLGRVAALVSALGLLLGGWFLPLWAATLLAPQYPGGLTLLAYGTRVTGDVAEIDTLNHYVGMRAFNPADVPEMALWPLALALAGVAVVVALLVRRRWMAILARVYLWGLPFGVLGAIQLRLHQYGTDLTPGAALRLDPFTPLVVGPTKVWNFTTWSRPGAGMWCLFGAALLVTFGPRLLDRIRRPRPPAATASAATLLLVVVLTLAAPTVAFATTDVGHDHGGHSHDQPGHDQSGHDHGGDGFHVPDVSGPVMRDPGEIAGRASTDGLVRHPQPLTELLRSVPAGGRLVLPEGIHQGPVVIDRPIVVEGSGRVVIEGDGSGSVVTIRAAGTELRSVTVRRSGPGPTGDPAGVRVEADDVTVEDVIVLDSYMGIAVASAARVRIVDNVVRGLPHASMGTDAHAVEHDAPGATTDNPAVGGHAVHDHEHGAGPASSPRRGDGVWLHEVDHVLVRGNLIEHSRDGVYVSFGSDAIIDRNHVHGSRYAVHSMFAGGLQLVENHLIDNLSGAVLMYGGPVLALRNHIEGSSSVSTGFAVLLKDIEGAEVVQNVLVGNRVGLHLEGPVDGGLGAVILANTIVRNTLGVSAYSSAHAQLGGNSLADNTVQVASQGGRLDGLQWSYRGFGNLWSTYHGYEGALPGRGAVEHTEGGFVDRLLLRDPAALALADTPALRLLRSIEQRWGRQAPVLVDELPLTVPQSPAVAAPADAGSGQVAALAVGIAMMMLPVTVLPIGGARAPAGLTERMSRRRWLHAVHT